MNKDFDSENLRLKTKKNIAIKKLVISSSFSLVGLTSLNINSKDEFLLGSGLILFFGGLIFSKYYMQEFEKINLKIRSRCNKD